MRETDVICHAHLLYLPCQDCRDKEKQVTDNPFKVGDKVQYKGRGTLRGPLPRTVLAVHENKLWLLYPMGGANTGIASDYIKAEEPIEAGQFWQRVGGGYSAVVESVTDKHVIYSTTLDDRLLVRTVASFREEYTR